MGERRDKECTTGSGAVGSGAEANAESGRDSLNGRMRDLMSLRGIHVCIILRVRDVCRHGSGDKSLVRGQSLGRVLVREHRRTDLVHRKTARRCPALERLSITQHFECVQSTPPELFGTPRGRVCATPHGRLSAKGDLCARFSPTAQLTAKLSS